MAARNNIEALRRARGWMRPELAKRMGTSPQQVERLEKGHRGLTLDWIERAAAALGVSEAAIISDLPGEAPDIPRTASADSGELAAVIRLDLSLPMGPGATVDDYVEEEPFLFDMGYLRSFTRTPPGRLRLASGVGDSMMPTLLPGDAVWIDSTQRVLNQSDKIWAVSINGGAAIKRLRPLKDGRVLIMSDNKTIGDYDVGADEIILGGRVIKFERDL